MQAECLSDTPTQDLTSTIAFLTDVHNALEQNSFKEEALIVSHHLKKLSTPDYQTRIELKGIEPVLAELAQVFY